MMKINKWSFPISLSLSCDDLVKIVFNIQEKNTIQGHFICLIKSDLEYIEEPQNKQNINSVNKRKFKMYINKILNQAVFNSLKVLQNTHSKVIDIKYQQFKSYACLKCHTF